MNMPETPIQPQTPPEAPERRPSTPAIKLDPRTYVQAQTCVHCGLCLPACPTYTENGREADSPRGRIQLMKKLSDGEIDATPTVLHHLDLCLDCRACETACPSGVIYHELIEETRALLVEKGMDKNGGTLMRWMFFHVLTHRERLKWAVLPARIMQKTGLYGLLRKVGLFDLLPAGWRKMEQMLPADGPLWPASLPEVTRAGGTDAMIATLAHHGDQSDAGPKAIVGFLGGCIGSVLFQKTNQQAVELLAAAGAEIHCPDELGCCGAIHHHSGAVAAAQKRARHNIDIFLPEGKPWVDRIATNIAGCGAMLREYDHLLRDDSKYASRAKEFSARVRDISEVLLELGLPEMKYPVNEVVTYHDACHLAHAQKVTAAPRQLLAKIPGLKLVPLYESDMCCGAAGTYNLTQPAMASDLADRKLKHIAATGATVCAAGNVGCALHIQGQAVARGQTLRVVHPVELLHRAVFGTPE
jgi:glycolate oxidase iron-sulfur subunit